MGQYLNKESCLGENGHNQRPRSPFQMQGGVAASRQCLDLLFNMRATLPPFPPSSPPPSPLPTYQDTSTPAN